MLENIVNQILTAQSLFGLFKFCLSSLFGLLIYISHSFFLNSYLRNQNSLLTAIILPPIIFIITLAISTDLFLSLGMIGALSIVRYRTPVKSQYDLVLLLSLICIGITTGVNLSYSILTVSFLIFIAPLFYFVKKRFPKKKKNENEESEKVLLVMSTEESLNETSEIFKNFGNILSIDSHEANGQQQTNCCLQFEKIEDAIKAQKLISEKVKVKSSNIGYQ